MQLSMPDPELRHRLMLPSADNHIYNQTYGIIDPWIARAMVILHEIGHATGAEDSNHSLPGGNIDYEKLRRYNDNILAKCFGLKPR
jgi:hypothetical protein